MTLLIVPIRKFPFIFASLWFHGRTSSASSLSHSFLFARFPFLFFFHFPRRPIFSHGSMDFHIAHQFRQCQFQAGNFSVRAYRVPDYSDIHTRVTASSSPSPIIINNLCVCVPKKHNAIDFFFPSTPHNGAQIPFR